MNFPVPMIDCFDMGQLPFSIPTLLVTGKAFTDPQGKPCLGSMLRPSWFLECPTYLPKKWLGTCLFTIEIRSSKLSEFQVLGDPEISASISSWHSQRPLDSKPSGLEASNTCMERKSKCDVKHRAVHGCKQNGLDYR